MNTLRFRCPATSREVDSGISIVGRTRLISVRARCPLCKEIHEWRAAGSALGTVSSNGHRASGARSSRAQSALRDFPRPSAEVVELRDQLLDELNHRLKNHLQMLFSLLQLASRKTGSAEAQAVLSDTSRRIGAMGTAQQIFYSVRDSTDVSGQGLLEAVCANAGAFFGKDVSINHGAIVGSLPKETAVPLALVLNELLTNAAKHGADERGRVTIDVGLSQRLGMHELRVQDHGCGFDFAKVQGRSSGLGLVTMLAHRLNGTFTVERKSGARCILRFPDQ
jgi:two-component sensor histidine kinase